MKFRSIILLIFLFGILNVNAKSDSLLVMKTINFRFFYYQNSYDKALLLAKFAENKLVDFENSIGYRLENRIDVFLDLGNSYENFEIEDVQKIAPSFINFSNPTIFLNRIIDSDVLISQFSLQLIRNLIKDWFLGSTISDKIKNEGEMPLDDIYLDGLVKCIFNLKMNNNNEFQSKETLFWKWLIKTYNHDQFKRFLYILKQSNKINYAALSISGIEFNMLLDSFEINNNKEINSNIGLKPIDLIPINYISQNVNSDLMALDSNLIIVTPTINRIDIHFLNNQNYKSIKNWKFQNTLNEQYYYNQLGVYKWNLDNGNMYFNPYHNIKTNWKFMGIINPLEILNFVFSKNEHIIFYKDHHGNTGIADFKDNKLNNLYHTDIEIKEFFIIKNEIIALGKTKTQNADFLTIPTFSSLYKINNKGTFLLCDDKLLPKSELKQVNDSIFSFISYRLQNNEVFNFNLNNLKITKASDYKLQIINHFYALDLSKSVFEMLVNNFTKCILISEQSNINISQTLDFSIDTSLYKIESKELPNINKHVLFQTGFEFLTQQKSNLNLANNLNIAAKKFSYNIYHLDNQDQIKLHHLFMKLDNSIFLTDKTTFIEEKSEILNPKISIIAGALIKEIFSKYGLAFLVRMPIISSGIDYKFILNKYNKSNTFQIMFSQNYYNPFRINNTQKNIQTLGDFSISLKDKSIKFGMNLRLDEMHFLSTSEYNLKRRPIKHFLISPYIFFQYKSIHSNKLLNQPDFKIENKSNFNLINFNKFGIDNALDINIIKLILPKTLIVNKLKIRNSIFNKTTQLIGGTQNWVNAIENETKLYHQSSILQYQNLAFVRGFPLGFKSGNSAILNQLEIKYLPNKFNEKRASATPFVKNLTFHLFTDQALCWYGINPFSIYNPDNERNYTQAGIEISVFSKKNPFMYSGGLGVSSQWLGYDICFEIAKGFATDYKSLWIKYITINKYF